jgi:hypothetical protein
MPVRNDPAPAPRGFTQDQIEAGWRSMSLLARFIQRGGHPAAVTPTIALRPDEKQYGSFLADVLTYSSEGIYAGGGIFWSGSHAAGGTGWHAAGRQAVTVTSERVVLQAKTIEGYEFRTLILVQPNPLDWSVNLYFQGAQPIMLRSVWVPWMTVVMSAELYGSPWPPGHAPGSDIPIRASAV